MMNIIWTRRAHRSLKTNLEWSRVAPWSGFYMRLREGKRYSTGSVSDLSVDQ
jgi:hypothetical protein